MVLYDILFLLAIVIGILTGIALGVHCAYIMAQSIINGDTSWSGNNGNHKQSRAKSRDREQKTRSEKPRQNTRDKAKHSQLKDRIDKSDKMSFSEFSCGLDDKDHAETLEQIRSQQDDSYNFLEDYVNP